MWDLLARCWLVDPSARPTAQQLCTDLKSLSRERLAQDSSDDFDKEPTPAEANTVPAEATDAEHVFSPAMNLLGQFPGPSNLGGGAALQHLSEASFRLGSTD
jgi:hypothetical protein